MNDPDRPSRGPARLARAHQRNSGRAEKAEQQREPREAQLGERLDVERVRVLDHLVDLAVAKPVGGEAMHAAARERMIGERVERHLPVVPAVRLESAEAFGPLLVG